MTDAASSSSAKRKTTLCFLLEDDKILLAMKKRGFGMGKWNGVGGKLLENESFEDGIIREAKEEIGITPVNLEKVGILLFHFEKEVEKLGKTEQTAVFICTKWEGKIFETEEMKPRWFGKNELPFPKMWEDDIYWLQRVIMGEKIMGEFWFDAEFRLTKHSVKETSQV